MYGKHSLTASVVAIGGPDGPRYYPGSHSGAGAELLASSLRSIGVPAIAIPLYLRMPDPGPLLSASAPPRLFAVARVDPFDMIEAEVLEDREQRGDIAEPHAAGDETEGTGESVDEIEIVGDESTFLGTASFQRVLDQWTVWLTLVEQGEDPQLVAAFPTLDDAWKEAERWRDDPKHDDWAAIIIGPGDGPVTVDFITLWPHKWTVRAVEGRLFGRPGGWPESQAEARKFADASQEICLVITAPYLPEANGGAR